MSLFVADAEHEADRADLVEAILFHNATAMRIPRHWTSDKTKIHQRLDDLLTELEALDGQGSAPHA